MPYDILIKLLPTAYYKLYPIGSDSGIGSDMDDKPPPAPGSSTEGSSPAAEMYVP